MFKIIQEYSRPCKGAWDYLKQDIPVILILNRKRWLKVGITGSYKSVQDDISVQITKTRIFIPITTCFLTKEMVKKGYYENEGFGLAWDRIEVRQMNPFITTFSLQFCKIFQNTFLQKTTWQQLLLEVVKII